MKKIFFVGAQGTGKSTLNRFIFDHPGLRRELHIKKSIDSISKMFFSDFSIFKKLNSPEFYEAQVKILVYASNLYLNTENFISSRGFADSYAYLMHYVSKTKNKNGLILIDTVKIFQEFLNQEEGVYTFYVPVAFDISDKNNNLRSNNLDFQQEIDIHIQQFLKITNTKYIIVKGSLEQRKKIIYNTITADLFRHENIT
ncbi:MAG TPA: hypothetical protein ENH06_00775 [bacterium]|nr:hypothetical protein [bacterium]